MIRISATYTAEPIERFLAHLFAAVGLPEHLSFADHGQLFQELLDPSKPTAGATSLVALLRLDDLMGSSNDAEALATVVDDLVAAVAAYRERSAIPVLVIPTPSWRHQALQLRFEGELTSRLAVLPEVYVFTSERVGAWYPVVEPFNLQSDLAASVPYAESYYAALALAVTRWVWRTAQREKKVLVFDCDNTLWKGVCAEAGPTGVAIGPEHRALQLWAKALAANGIVIALCSKNIERDVFEVFDSHPDMVLSRGDIVAHAIGWEAKSEGLRKLAADLDLGLDTFVFLDDNPVEIAEVRSLCAQVLAVELPQTESGVLALTEHFWPFDKYRVTEADTKRAQSYKDNATRAQLARESESFASFLAKLELVIDVAPLAAADVPRIAQMSQRVNQFNATGRRYSESEVAAWIGDAARRAYTCRVRDRFGDYGLVGFVAATASGDEYVVTDYLLSCRVLGKGVEHKILSRIAADAAEHGFDLMYAEFRSTERNLPLARFYRSLPHTAWSDTDGERFEFSTASGFEFEPGGDEAEGPPETPQGARSTGGDDIALEQMLDFMLSHRSASELVERLDSARVPRGERLQTAYLAPRGETEQRLAKIWERVLHVVPIGRSDRFYDLGGRSLDMVRVHGAIGQEFGRKIEIANLFNRTTVAEIAELLGAGGDASARMASARERAMKQRRLQTAFRVRDQGNG